MKGVQVAIFSMFLLFLLVVPRALSAFTPPGHFLVTYHTLGLFWSPPSFSPEEKRLLILGSIDPDFTEGGLIPVPGRPYDHRYHFDNDLSYADVCSNYEYLNYRIQALLSRDDKAETALQFGRILHAIQDFYSHSNYILLYRRYQADKHEMNEIPPPIEEVWSHVDQYPGFMKLVASELRTGVFPDSSDVKPEENHGDPLDPWSPGMNKDSGARDFNYEAEKTAEQASEWYLQLYLRNPDRVTTWGNVRKACLPEPEPISPQLAAAIRNQVRHGPQSRRINAIRALATDNSPDSVRLLIEILQHNPVTAVRAEAVLAMKHRSAPDILAALKFAAASDSASVVRQYAVEALASSRSKESLELLTDLTSSPYPTAVRVSAISGLEAIHSSAVTELLTRLLQDGLGSVRAEALTVLAQQGTTTHPDIFVTMLSDHSPAVISAAAQGIGEFKLKSAGPLLAGLLSKSSNEQVRRESAESLGKLGDRAFTRVLTTVARSRSEKTSVRIAALRSLALIGDFEAAAPLIVLLNDPEPAVRVAAADACIQLRSYDASPKIRRLLISARGRTRSELIVGSGLWPEEFKGPLLSTILGAGDLHDRELALDDINALPATEKVDVDAHLRILLAQNQPLALQYAAARFLQQRRSKENVEAISHLRTAARSHSDIQQLLAEAIERQVPVPDVTNHSFAEARRIIVDAGLVLGDVRVTQDPTATGNVFLQSPPPLGTRPLGSAMTVYTSTGPAGIDDVGLPDFISKGARVDDARRDLRAKNLNPVIAREGRCESGEIVVAQLPGPGEQVKKYGNVYLSLGNRNLIPVPKVVGRSAIEVNAEPERHFYFTFHDSGKGGFQIYEQRPKPETEAFCGSEVEVWY